MVNVREEYPRFQQAGGEVAVVAMAESEQAAEFRDRYELPFRVLSDPRREAYEAFGLERGSIWSIAGPAVWAAGLKSFLRFGGGMPVGDPLQLGGSFVIDRNGVICYAHRSVTSSDRAPNDEIIAALEASACSN